MFILQHKTSVLTQYRCCKLTEWTNAALLSHVSTTITHTYLFSGIDLFHHGHNFISCFMCSPEKIREMSVTKEGRSSHLFFMDPEEEVISSSFSILYCCSAVCSICLLCAENAEISALHVFAVVECNCQINQSFLLIFFFFLTDFVVRP